MESVDLNKLQYDVNLVWSKKISKLQQIDSHTIAMLLLGSSLSMTINK